MRNKIISKDSLMSCFDADAKYVDATLTLSTVSHAVGSNVKDFRQFGELTKPCIIQRQKSSSIKGNTSFISNTCHEMWDI